MGKENKRRRKAGRKPKYDAKHDKELADAWKVAHRNGMDKVDFAKEKGYSLKDFGKLLGRVRKGRTPGAE